MLAKDGISQMGSRLKSIRESAKSETEFYKLVQKLFDSEGVPGAFVVNILHQNQANTMFASGCTVQFQNEKDQFLYELKGGNNGFAHLITGIYNSVMLDHFKAIVDNLKTHAEEYVSSYEKEEHDF